MDGHFGLQPEYILDSDEVKIFFNSPIPGRHGVFNAKWASARSLAKSADHKNGDFITDCVNVLRLLFGKRRHPCIEEVHGIVYCEKIPYLITEYTDVPLCDYLGSSNFDAHVPCYEDKVRLALNVACGLRQLHKRQPPIVHCSLCCESILISLPTSSKTLLIQAKISDLSQAREIKSQWFKPSPNMFPYLPPLYRVGALATEREDLYCETHIDVYSLAVVIIAIETRQVPSLEDDPTHLMNEQEVLYNIALRGILKKKCDKMMSVEEVYRQLDSYKEPVIVGCRKKIRVDTPGMLEGGCLGTNVVKVKSPEATVCQSELHSHGTTCEVPRPSIEVKSSKVSDAKRMKTAPQDENPHTHKGVQGAQATKASQVPKNEVKNESRVSKFFKSVFRSPDTGTSDNNMDQVLSDMGYN